MLGRFFPLMVAATVISSTWTSLAHDSWISRGKFKNKVGEWCCGDNDCEAPEQITTNGTGWIVNGGEYISYDEATPSPDGKVWICRRPDKTRRCVFGPPPNM